MHINILMFDKYQHFGAHKGSIQSKHYENEFILKVGRKGPEPATLF